MTTSTLQPPAPPRSPTSVMMMAPVVDVDMSKALQVEDKPPHQGRSGERGSPCSSTCSRSDQDEQQPVEAFSSRPATTAKTTVASVESPMRSRTGTTIEEEKHEAEEEVVEEEGELDVYQLLAEMDAELDDIIVQTETTTRLLADGDTRSKNHGVLSSESHDRHSRGDQANIQNLQDTIDRLRSEKQALTERNQHLELQIQKYKKRRNKKHNKKLKKDNDLDGSILATSFSRTIQDHHFSPSRPASNTATTAVSRNNKSNPNNHISKWKHRVTSVAMISSAMAGPAVAVVAVALTVFWATTSTNVDGPSMGTSSHRTGW